MGLGLAHDIEKLKELILYICHKCKDRNTFGSIVLNKLLFYSDFYHYAESGKPITGEVYRKAEHGIVPTNLLAARGQLIDEGKLDIKHIDYMGNLQKKSVALVEPTFMHISKDDAEFADKIISKFGDMNGREISDHNHREVVFLYAKDGQTIPYNRIYALGKINIPADVQMWGIQRALSLGYKPKAA